MPATRTISTKHMRAACRLGHVAVRNAPNGPSARREIGTGGVGQGREHTFGASPSNWPTAAIDN
ncbi:hypothetical protein F5X71_14740 [Nocardia brasiliensis]|uniref:Uncharacterized protein n=1 Tax=Nocardia brasiliensis TaxID=37326 RepID=A0A6G9XR71_NOCBR|nr:hypothetical protein [Nocardia brasiliensis]QIS03409.1 hypothetical protein F5X71_14740 [Nocardia brasiliensis]